MLPAVNFGGSVVGGIGWPGLKNPTGSQGSLLMSSGGWAGEGRGGRGVPGTRSAAARAAIAAILELMYGNNVPARSNLRSLAAADRRGAALKHPPRRVAGDALEVRRRCLDALRRVARVEHIAARAGAGGGLDVGAEEAARQRRGADRARCDVLAQRDQRDEAVVDDAEAARVRAAGQLDRPRVALDAVLEGDRVARAVQPPRLARREDEQQGADGRA